MAEIIKSCDQLYIAVVPGSTPPNGGIEIQFDEGFWWIGNREFTDLSEAKIEALRLANEQWN